jgi:hypothetical protein
MRQCWSFCLFGHARDYAPTCDEWQEKVKAKWKQNEKSTNIGPFNGHLARIGQ